MKSFTIFIIVFISSICSFAQGFTYQGIATDINGVPISSSPISFYIYIHDQTASGTVVYEEKQSSTTTTNGVFSIIVGNGTTQGSNNTFASINWSNGDKYLQIKMDPAGGTAYQDMGTSKLQTVPFAFYANTAKIQNISISTTNTATSDGQVLTYNKTNNVWEARNLPAQTPYTGTNGITVYNNTISGVYTGSDGITVDNSKGTISGSYIGDKGISVSKGVVSATLQGTNGITFNNGVIGNNNPGITYNSGTGISISGNTINSTVTGVPVGTILSFAGDTNKIPAGYLLCNGKELNEFNPTYQALFQVIGEIWGSSAPGNTFKLPDLRGQFLRGADLGKGIDPKDNRTGGSKNTLVGSNQIDAFQGHQHPFGTPSNGELGMYGGRYYSNSSTTGKNVGDPITDGTNGSPRTSKETRPVNVYVNYIIKY